MAEDAASSDLTLPEGLVVTQQPKLDLETYLKNYTGRTRLLRLIFISRYSPYLRSEALQLAREEASRGDDPYIYKTITSLQREADPSNAESEEDSSRWITQKRSRNNAKTAQLENELKAYKNNLVNESIRMGYEDLAKHLYNIGDLNTAVKAMNGLRPLCATPKHIFELSVRRIVVAAEQWNFNMIQNNISKARPQQNETETDSAETSILSAAMGLVHLSNSRYREAAVEFLKVTSNIGESFNNVLSSNDIAIYASLCALATYSRSALKSNVLENKSFREFLELEPQMRRCISAYYNLKFRTVLEILEDIKADLALDMHLAPHITQLYRIIREKSIVQYFAPYSRVPLATMANNFSTTVEGIEQECIALIGSDKLSARVDAVSGDLVVHASDERREMFENAAQVAEDYVFELKSKLWQMQMVEAGQVLKTGAKTLPIPIPVDNNNTNNNSGSFEDAIRSHPLAAGRA